MCRLFKVFTPSYSAKWILSPVFNARTRGRARQFRVASGIEILFSHVKCAGGSRGEDGTLVGVVLYVDMRYRERHLLHVTLESLCTQSPFRRSVQQLQKFGLSQCCNCLRECFPGRTAASWQSADRSSTLRWKFLSSEDGCTVVFAGRCRGVQRLRPGFCPSATTSGRPRAA